MQKRSREPFTLAGLAKNPQLAALNSDLLSAPGSAKLAHQGSPVTSGGVSGPMTPPRAPGSTNRLVMNKTEKRFANTLNARMLLRNIASWHYEMLTLRWGSAKSVLTYTPDFTVFENAPEPLAVPPLVRITFMEVKGAYIWPKDLTKFKAAKAAFPQFNFELHQWKDKRWNQIA